MRTVAKIGMAAAVLLLAWWLWSRFSSDARTSSEREVANSKVDATETLATSVASTPLVRLAGIVVDEKGRPLADVEVGALCDGEKIIRDTPRAKSGADGRFEIDEPAGAGSLRSIGDKWFTIGAPPFGPSALPCDRVVCVAPREALEGIVVDRGGAPVEGVRVEIVVLASELHLPQSASDLRSCSRFALSARDGTYRIDDAPAASAAQVSARRLGSACEYHRVLADLSEHHGRIVFDFGLDQALVLRGKVLDELDRPIASACIDVGPKNHHENSPFTQFAKVRSDADGRFEIPIAKDLKDVVLLAAARGRMSTTLEPQGDPALESSWPVPLVIRLNRPALAIRGRVVDAQGLPLPDAWIDLIDGTQWGWMQRADEALAPIAQFTWEAFASGRDGAEHVLVDAQGQFEIGELAARTYRLVAFDARSLHSVISEPIAAGASEVELVIDTSHNRELIAGRVVDSAGIAVRGARVKLNAIIPFKLEDSGPRQNLTDCSSKELLTDQEGRFEFRGTSLDAKLLVSEPPSARWVRGSVVLSLQKDLEHIELKLPRVTFIRLELSDDALGSGSEETRVDVSNDGIGSTANSIGGNSIQMSFSREHRSGVFPIADSVRFLMVRRGNAILQRIPVALEAGKVNVVRR